MLQGNTLNHIGLDGNTIITKVTAAALVGDTIYDIVNNGVGTTFSITCTVAAGASVVAAGMDLTGVATGTLYIEDVIVQVGATALDSAAENATMEFRVNNAIGTGTWMSLAEAMLTAQSVNSMLLLTQSTNVIENGKKVKVYANGEDFTDDGPFKVIFIFRRLSDGATIAGAT